jgi:hypothetical protein
VPAWRDHRAHNDDLFRRAAAEVWRQVRRVLRGDPRLLVDISQIEDWTNRAGGGFGVWLMWALDDINDRLLSYRSRRQCASRHFAGGVL